MVKRLVTQEKVNEAAEALLQTGVSEPTVIQVRNHLGMGSFTTIRPLLSIWETERKCRVAEALQVPQELSSKAQAWVSLAWSLATAQARQAVEDIRLRMVAERRASDMQLAEAAEEIRRLETERSDWEDRLQALEGTLRQGEIALAEARTRAERVGVLEGEIASLKSALAQSREEGRTAALESARLGGQVEILKKQVLAAEIRG